MWIIKNVNGRQWGTETFPTEEAARQKLRDFWKGVSGVNLKKFEIVEEKRSSELPSEER